MKNQNAIITGSTSGIGLAMAQVLASHGVNLVLNGLGNSEEIEKIRQSLEKQYKIKAIYHGADMTKPHEIQDMVASSLAKFGKIDILINNAGVQHVNRIEEFPENKWDWVIAINLSAAFHATKAILPSMQKNNFGRIINVASVHGLVASPDKSAYIAAKHGIIGLTKATALENAKQNITCNAICPGVVMTPLVEKQINDRAREKSISVADALEEMFLQKQPNKRAIPSEHIGNAILVFLGVASSSITGISLPVDGGWTAQ